MPEDSAKDILIRGVYDCIWSQVMFFAYRIDICLNVIFYWWSPSRNLTLDGGADTRLVVTLYVSVHADHRRTNAIQYVIELSEILVSAGVDFALPLVVRFAKIERIVVS